MLAWKKQGVAFVSSVSLTDGRQGNVGMVGGRGNQRGIAGVLPGTGSGGGALDTKMLTEVVDLLTPDQMVEILCMQERAFGGCDLPEFAE